jgi:hypothetical protein
MLVIVARSPCCRFAIFLEVAASIMFDQAILIIHRLIGVMRFNIITTERSGLVG